MTDRFEIELDDALAAATQSSVLPSGAEVDELEAVVSALWRRFSYWSRQDAAQDAPLPPEWFGWM